MELVTIEAEVVDIHCYHGPKEKLFVQLEALGSSEDQQAIGKVIKIVFLVYNMSLK